MRGQPSCVVIPLSPLGEYHNQADGRSARRASEKASEVRTTGVTDLGGGIWVGQEFGRAPREVGVSRAPCTDSVLGFSRYVLPSNNRNQVEFA